MTRRPVVTARNVEGAGGAKQRSMRGGFLMPQEKAKIAVTKGLAPLVAVNHRPVSNEMVIWRMKMSGRWH
jgi:hypothetical protein